MKIVTIVLLCFCLFSCGNKSESNIQDQKKEESKHTITKSDIEKLDFIEFIIDDKAGSAIDSWQKFLELQSILENVKQADYSYFKENHELLETLIKELKTTIPNQLDSPSIQARLIVIETKMFKLESIVNLSNAEKEDVLSSIKEVLESFSNLNLQINKKFEKESQRIEKP